MQKKTTILILIIVIILLLIGGVYWWWQGEAELRELNKNLPEGIRVEKRNGQEVIINTIDSYEIKVPEEWGGLKNVNFRKIENEGIISIGGKNYQFVEVKTFSTDKVKDITSWVRKIWEEKPIIYTNPEIFEQGKIGNYDLLKVKDFGGVMGNIFFYYLKNDSKIYEFYSDSEEVIQDIILNGNF